MAPGLFSDIYCASKAHIFISLRNKWCKDWDSLHPVEAATSRGEEDAKQINDVTTTRRETNPSSADGGEVTTSTTGDKRLLGRANAAQRRTSPEGRVMRGQAIAAATATSSPNDTLDAVPTNDAANHTPVAATSLPHPVGPFPSGFTPSATDSNKNTSITGSTGASSGMIAGVVLGACFAVLVVAGFLVHRHRRRSAAARGASNRFALDDEQGVFRPDVMMTVSKEAGVGIRDFSSAPPGLMDLPRGHAGSMAFVPLDAPTPYVAPPRKRTTMSRQGNRDSWPVEPRPNSMHRRTPTKDVIFVHKVGDDDAPLGLHLNEFVVSPPLPRDRTGSVLTPSPTGSEHDVFGTPIYEDLTAAINAATASILASPTATSTSQRNILLRSSSGSNASSPSQPGSRTSARFLEDRHSMEWPEDDLDDPITMMRLEEELRAVRGDSLRGVIEEFPSVPTMDTSDPRFNKV